MEYNVTTRTLIVHSLREHLDNLSDEALRLLQRALPVDVLLGSIYFCSLTGLNGSIQRAFVHHDVSIAYEASILLDERAIEKRKEALTSGESI